MYNMSKEIQLSSLSLEFYIDNDVRSEHHGHADDAGAKGGLYTLDIFPQDHTPILAPTLRCHRTYDRKLQNMANIG
jgi:hypothetical protein